MSVNITPEDITKFFKDHNAKAECPSCGKNNWVFLSPEGRLVLKLPLGNNDANMDLGPFIPTITLICGNCTYMRMHSAALLAQKLNLGA